LASPSAGFLSPFRDSDLTTFCRVHSTGTRKGKESALEATERKEFLARSAVSGRRRDSQPERVLLGLTGVRGGAAAAVGVRGGAVGVPGGPARDDSAPTSRATNPPPVAAADELAPKLDCPTSPGARTCTSDESEAAVSFTISIEQLQEQSAGEFRHQAIDLTRLLLPKRNRTSGVLPFF